MTVEKKKPNHVKSAEEKPKKSAKISADEIDLGDADDSSGNLGMDNFKPKNKDLLPSEKGRIEEL